MEQEQKSEAPAVVDVDALIKVEAEECHLPLGELTREVERELIARAVQRLADRIESDRRGPQAVTW